MSEKGKNKKTKMITITIPYWLYMWAIQMSLITATLAVLSTLENHNPFWVIAMAFLVVVSVITAIRLILAEENNRYHYKTNREKTTHPIPAIIKHKVLGNARKPDYANDRQNDSQRTKGRLR